MPGDVPRLRAQVKARMAEFGMHDWTQLGTRSGVKPRTLTNILGGAPSRRRTVVELALGWAPGSIEAILAGGEATALPPEQGISHREEINGSASADVDDLTDSDRAVISEVAEAIRRDVDVIDEVRQRLLNQCERLRRIPQSAVSPQTPPDPSPAEETFADRYPRLRAQQERLHGVRDKGHGEGVAGEEGRPGRAADGGRGVLGERGGAADR